MLWWFQRGSGARAHTHTCPLIVSVLMQASLLVLLASRKKPLPNLRSRRFILGVLQLNSYTFPPF